MYEGIIKIEVRSVYTNIIYTYVVQNSGGVYFFEIIVIHTIHNTYVTCTEGTGSTCSERILILVLVFGTYLSFSFFFE